MPPLASHCLPLPPIASHCLPLPPPTSPTFPEKYPWPSQGKATDSSSVPERVAGSNPVGYTIQIN